MLRQPFRSEITNSSANVSVQVQTNFWSASWRDLIEDCVGLQAKTRRWSSQSKASASILFRRVAVSSIGCWPFKMASIKSGARKANCIERETSPALMPSAAAISEMLSGSSVRVYSANLRRASKIAVTKFASGVEPWRAAPCSTSLSSPPRRLTWMGAFKVGSYSPSNS